MYGTCVLEESKGLIDEEGFLQLYSTNYLTELSISNPKNSCFCKYKPRWYDLGLKFRLNQNQGELLYKYILANQTNQLIILLMESTNPKKTLVIMRGLPGSGKSYKAKKLAEAGHGVVYSTDDFFEIDGKYVMDFSKLGEYHEKNRLRTEEALKDGKHLVIVDNTNIKLWEMKGYVELAKQYGYEVDIQTSDTEWAWDPSECAKKTTHGVPADKLKFMKDNFEKFESLEDILKATMKKGRK